MLAPDRKMRETDVADTETVRFSILPHKCLSSPSLAV